MRGWNFNIRSPVAGYIFALILTAIAILVRCALTPILNASYVHSTVYPAIVVVAIFAGRGPAILTAVLGAFLAPMFFMPGLRLSDLPGVTMIILTGFLAGWLAQRLRDAVARTETEAKALDLTQQRYRTIFNNAGVGILSANLQGRFIDVNDRICKMLGYTRDEILNMTVQELTYIEDRPDSAVINQQLHDHLFDQITYEKRYVKRDGSPLWVSVTVSGAWDAAGQFLLALAVVEDITERKNAREKLLKLNEDLENKNEELETIIGIVSHDLRAPLVNVKGFATEINKDLSIVRQMLREDASCHEILKKIAPVLDRFPESSRFIISSAEAMDNLAASLVSVARAGLGAISPEQIDMNKVIANVVASIKFKLQQNNISYYIDTNLPACFGDKTQVTQVFTNLIDNAVKYLDPERHGQICLGGDIQVGRALYWVADNGIGIALQDQGKIFDPYRQLHEKAAEGVGLGLATVKRMVDRNNGKIWVYSEKGKGTTFYIALPINPHI